MPKKQTSDDFAQRGPKGEVQRVAQVLMQRILSGDYAAGLRLPAEATLAEQFECGRSTIREALRHLADLGLVQSRRGSGATVLDFRSNGRPALLPAYLQVGKFDHEPLVLAKEMLRFRTLMAAEAVQLAARYATADGLENARQLLAKAPSLADDPAAHAVNELAFYRALVVASGIWPAVWMVNDFWTALNEINRRFAPALGSINPAFQSTMVALLELVEARRDEDAANKVRAWFATVDAELLTVIGYALNAFSPRSPSPNTGT